jgi:hypothetical protein
VQVQAGQPKRLPDNGDERTDTARGKDFDSSMMCDVHGCGDRCSAVKFSGDDKRQIATRDFTNVFIGSEFFDLIVCQTDVEFAFENGDCCGNCTFSLTICSGDWLFPDFAGKEARVR